MKIKGERETQETQGSNATTKVQPQTYDIDITV